MPLAHGGTPMLIYLSVDYPNLNPISSRAPLPPIVVLTPLHLQTLCPARTPLSLASSSCLPPDTTKPDTSLSSHIWRTSGHDKARHVALTSHLVIWKVGPAYDALMLEVVAKHPTWLGVPGFPSPVSYSPHRFLHFGWEKVGGVCW